MKECVEVIGPKGEERRRREISSACSFIPINAPNNVPSGEAPDTSPTGKLVRPENA
jgi:hypothetical protein